MSEHIFTDGVKSFTLDQYRPEAWTWLSGGPDDGEDEVMKTYYRMVPWLFRGVHMRASAVARLPFEIRKLNGDVFDSSDDYQNKLGWLPNPQRFLWLTAAAQTLTGSAYWFNVRTGRRTTSLKYLIPTSITPKYSEKTNEFTGFERMEKFYPLANNDIIYFWLNDPYVEVQPAKAYPAKAALHAAGAKFNVDEFVSAYFKRGAVRPTVLTVSGNPPQQERERIENWWNKLMTGIGNAFRWRVMNADTINALTLGDGLDALSDSELSADVRYDIAAALGIPQTKLFSSDAGGLGGGGVAAQDDFTFYNETIIPAFDTIAQEFNRLLLEPLGLRLVECHERMDLFQEDEAERADSLVNITTALDANPKAALAAAQLLGMELPPEVEQAIAELIAEKEQAREQMAQISQRPAQGEDDEGTTELRPVSQKSTETTPSAIDMEKWQRKALKRLKGGDEACCSFESEHISAALAGAIEGALKHAHTPEQVKAVFSSVWVGYP